MCIILSLLLFCSSLLNLYFYHVKVRKSESTKLRFLERTVSVHILYMNQMLDTKCVTLPDLYLELENRLSKRS